MSELRLCDVCRQPAVPARSEVVCMPADGAAQVVAVSIRLRNTADLCGACLVRQVAAIVGGWVQAQPPAVQGTGLRGAASCIRRVVSSFKPTEGLFYRVRLDCGHGRLYGADVSPRPREGDWVYCAACHDG